MKRSIAVIGIALGFALGGCATTEGNFKEAAPPPPGQGLVYMYRPSQGLFGGRPAFFDLDGAEFIYMDNRSYTRVYLPAGRHRIIQRWNRSAWEAALSGGPTQSADLALDVEAGEVYYVRLGVWSGGSSLMWNLQHVSPELAAREIRATDYQLPLASDPRFACTTDRRGRSIC